MMINLVLICVLEDGRRSIQWMQTTLMNLASTLSLVLIEQNHLGDSLLAVHQAQIPEALPHLQTRQVDQPMKCRMDHKTTRLIVSNASGTSNNTEVYNNLLSVVAIKSFVVARFCFTQHCDCSKHLILAPNLVLDVYNGVIGTLVSAHQKRISAYSENSAIPGVHTLRYFFLT